MDPPNAPQAQPLLGGRYEIQQSIGSGGMANVLLAKDLNLQRDVAVKLLRDDFTSDPAFRVRFLQEARSAANLVHPNIVTVYDFGHDEERYFIIMEYVHGTNLKALMRRKGPLEVEEAIALMIQISAGVGYAHRAGLVHCDLKPHNMLITTDGRAKITDFGISRALSSISHDEDADIVWGSPQYFSPEQAGGKPPSPASDVYSLGVVLYEMLTGRLPFEAADPLLLSEMHQLTPPPSARQYNPAIPEEIENILYKILSKEPSARYRTAGQLERVLTTFAPQTGPYSAEGGAMAAEAAYNPDSMTMAYESTPSTGVDWIAVLLGLLAFLAIGGLLPLWLWACFLYPSCPLGF